MSGFMKPVSVSNSLCDFLGRYRGTKLSRVEVTKEICYYIKEKKLQDPSDRRIIIPDMRLATLLNYDEEVDGPLTYYFLQKKLQPHFSSIAEVHSKKSRKNPKDYSDPNDYSDLK